MLPLESDMPKCPDRKWHHGWIPTSLALCPTPSLTVSLPEHSLFSAVPFLLHHRVEVKVCVHCTWERQVTLQDNPLGSTASTASSVWMATGQTSKSGPAGLKHRPSESEQLHLHGLGGASASQGLKQSKGKVQKKSQTWFLREQISLTNSTQL